MGKGSYQYRKSKLSSRGNFIFLERGSRKYGTKKADLGFIIARWKKGDPCLGYNCVDKLIFLSLFLKSTADHCFFVNILFSKKYYCYSRRKIYSEFTLIDKWMEILSSWLCVQLCPASISPMHLYVETMTGEGQCLQNFYIPKMEGSPVFSFLEDPSEMRVMRSIGVFATDHVLRIPTDRLHVKLKRIPRAKPHCLSWKL